MSIFTKKQKKDKEYKKTEKAGDEKNIAPASRLFNTPKSVFMVKQVWITEKAGDMSHLRKYNFIVDKKANKLEIKKAIESIYGVKVVSVNVVNIKGKSRRMGRTLGRTSSYKKAIVTLKEGQKIDVMPT
ncbi:MAG: 50S ribosomal protein L23 [Patescibacteria group bacterium]